MWHFCLCSVKRMWSVFVCEYDVGFFSPPQWRRLFLTWSNPRLASAESCTPSLSTRSKSERVMSRERYEGEKHKCFKMTTYSNKQNRKAQKLIKHSYLDFKYKVNLGLYKNDLFLLMLLIFGVCSISASQLLCLRTNAPSCHWAKTRSSCLLWPSCVSMSRSFSTILH